MMHQFRIGMIIYLLACLVNQVAYAQEPDMYKLSGFATMGAGTSGGAGGDTITVSTGSELQNAIKSRKNNPTPIVIFVEGTINLANSEGLSKIDVKELDGISVIGTGPGAEFDGIGLKIFRASNVILRNLKVHHVLSGEKDCISIEGPADHIWIDHCELYNEYPDVDKDYYDGLLDAKADCEYITYSWNFLHDSWKTALVGSSEGDVFDRKLTMHHNYFLNCNSRLPLFRASTGHFFNNYFKDITSTVINSRINSCVRIENNYFENANNPWVSAYSDILGGGEIIGNELVNSPFHFSDDTHELPECAPDIPYIYTDVLHEASEIPELLKAHSGVGKLDMGTGKETPAARSMSLKFHPNPLSGEGSITFISGNPGNVSLSIIDIKGSKNVLYKGFVQNTNPGSIELNTDSYESGLYMIELISGDERIISRLVILN